MIITIIMMIIMIQRPPPLSRNPNNKMRRQYSDRKQYIIGLYCTMYRLLCVMLVHNLNLDCLLLSFFVYTKKAEWSGLNVYNLHDPSEFWLGNSGGPREYVLKSLVLKFLIELIDFYSKNLVSR